MSIPATLALSAALACATVQASAQELRSSRRSISYHTVEIRGLKIFYREAGPADAPTVLLLHGFPSSSRMWEPLLPLLADKYHLIAPDYPGFGNSSAPPPSGFAYTFDNIAGVIGELTAKLGLSRFVLFMQDYGGPVGFRMALAHPERTSAIIIQNAVSHEQGLSPLWEARRRYWADPAHELEALKANFTSLEATRQRHLGSSPRPERYDPDTWTDEYAFLTRPGPGRDPDHAVPGLPDQRRVLSQMAGLAAQDAATDAGGLGKYDPSFAVAGATAYRDDVPEAEVHILEAGHFALDEATDEIASFVRDFLARLDGHKG
ncbi:alpha/beta fold hydrolase [Bradyrhizobium diazoefficiens]|uniref:alpha/beta fold hydrolase n=1 Tax=Bradyrhizobium diazoefficiens TaxID=1355477 RepID=UPI00272CF74B|nr:alpha/beta hydrolase [Bradyrhizobium diazoefficiens]WLA67698.1 alpha/beta hydrolase [Bradyrhizobium diazoefficiens]